MGKLMAIALIAAGLWGGYWFIGSAAVERGLIGWFDAQRAQGWQAEYASLNTAGFPSRFDTTISDLKLGDPAAGLIWAAPMVQFLALSYRPNHIIAVLPPSQTLTTPYETVQITSDGMRGSVVFKPGTALALDHSAFVLQNLALAAASGWSLALTEGRLATRQTVAIENAHDVAFQALDLAPDTALRRLFDPGAQLPATVDTLKLDATLQFDAPWDRFALDGAHPQITTLDLKLAQATWGTLDLQAAGTLSIDDRGIPTGRITLTATNWRAMLAMAVDSGLVPPDLAQTAERGLALLAGMSGTPDTLSAPLSFQNGLVSFGPVPLGAAPRLR